MFIKEHYMNVPATIGSYFRGLPEYVFETFGMLNISAVCHHIFSACLCPVRVGFPDYLIRAGIMYNIHSGKLLT